MSSSEGQLVFQDSFDGNLDADWTWLREHPEYWRLQDGGLEMRVEPGVADTARNALLRPAPSRRQDTLAIEVTVTNHTLPTIQYEQAGITWYCDGKPVFKEVKELIDGDLFIIPGRTAMAARSVRLRLIVTADSWEAQFRPEGESEFRTSERGELPAPADDQVSIQCYNGPPDEEHWIRFEEFTIRKLS